MGRITETRHKDIYACKRMRLLEYLKEHGFTPIKAISDPTNDRYNWWLFENTPELEACVSAYFEKIQNRSK
jgi:hypothetical protein